MIAIATHTVAQPTPGCVDTATTSRLRGIIAVSGTCLDFVVRPQGPGLDAKTPVQTSVTVGGMAFNGAPIAVANGLSTTIVTAQAAGPAADFTRTRAEELGIELHLIERNGDQPGVTIVLPSEHAGHWELFIQRCRPPCTRDFTAEMIASIREARALIAGPIPMEHHASGLLTRLAMVAENAAYTALIPHPTLIASPDFVASAAEFRYIQMNFAESQCLPGATGDLIKNTLVLRHLLGPDRDYVITNGAQRGWAWLEGHWYPIDPLPARPVCDTGAGDVFCFAYVTARAFFGKVPRDALKYAVQASTHSVERKNAPVLLSIET